jgi:hypothetical protein
VEWQVLAYVTAVSTVIFFLTARGRRGRGVTVRTAG